jgi:hypothetical protein
MDDYHFDPFFDSYKAAVLCTGFMRDENRFPDGVLLKTDTTSHAMEQITAKFFKVSVGTKRELNECLKRQVFHSQFLNMYGLYSDEKKLKWYTTARVNFFPMTPDDNAQSENAPLRWLVARYKMVSLALIRVENRLDVNKFYVKKTIMNDDLPKVDTLEKASAFVDNYGYEFPEGTYHNRFVRVCLAEFTQKQQAMGVQHIDQLKIDAERYFDKFLTHESQFGKDTLNGGHVLEDNKDLKYNFFL